MSGDDVDELMIILVKIGFLKPGNINSDHLFTDEIEKAVRSFQSGQDSLTVNGQVDPMTTLYLKQVDEKL